jgi:thymidylate kinase
MPSSDQTAQVTTVEGMPGAGKTTLLAALAGRGHTVLPEYTTATGDVLALDRHPHHADEDSHLTNWLTKSAHLRAAAGPVWVDRDWLTALAWSASTGDLAQRAAWAFGHLRAGRLLVPQRWIVLDLPPHLSLKRRTTRLAAGHPWSDPNVLHRLRAFYLDPPTALDRAHPALAELVASVPRQDLDAGLPPQALANAVAPAGAR